MNTTQTSSLIGSQRISTFLTITLAVLALAAGWILKNSITNQTQHYERAGVSADIPAKWAVKNGLFGEELVFATNPPLDFNLSYQVRLLPIGTGGKTTDLVVARNLAQGQSLPYYQVIKQQAIQLGGRSGYQVTYSYIKANTPGEVPVVISGMDTYFEGPDKVLLVTIENIAAHFEESLSDFNHFLQSVKYQKAGG